MPRPESDALLEDHSDRLGRLEGNYTEVAAQLASQSVQIDQLGKDVAGGVQSLSTKIDVVFAPLKLVDDKIAGHDGRLKVLEEADKIKRERRKTIRMVMMAGILAAAGAAGKALFDLLWPHIHLFH